jgi:uncharacterized protein YfaS (alpha-2-macroglobulin family)
MKNRILSITILAAFSLVSLVIVTGCRREGSMIGYDKGDINRQLKSDARKLEEIRVIELEKNVDFSSSTVNYFDVKDFDNSSLAAFEDDTPLTIVDYGPVDELPYQVKNPTIYVMFSQPIVPLAKLGEPMTSSSIMSIAPAIKGTYRWYGTKLLSFEPEEGFTPQNRYTVSIDPDTSSLGGKTLEGENSFSFHTEYLGILSMQPSGQDNPPELAQNIIVHFKYPVEIKTIREYLKVECEGNIYPFKISRPERKEWMTDEYMEKTVLLKVSKSFPEQSTVSVTMLEGARSRPDYLGTKEQDTRTFGTLKAFTYRYHDTYSYSFPKSSKGDSNPLYLKFSHPVDPDTVLDNINTSFDIEDLGEHVDVSNTQVRIANLPVSYNSTYKVYIDSGLKDIYGRSLGTEKEITVAVEGALRYSYFPNTGSKILEAQFPPRVAYEYQNVYYGTWKVNSIEDPYRDLISKASLEPYDFSTLPRDTKRYEVLDLKRWLNEDGKGFVGLAWNFRERELPETISESTLQELKGKISDPMIRELLTELYYTDSGRADYQLNKRWQVRDKRSTLSRYMEENYPDYMRPPDWGQQNLLLQVTDLAITTRVAHNKVVSLVTSMSTGEPVKNATVQLLNHETGMVQRKGKTDSDGLSVIELSGDDIYKLFMDNRGYSRYPRIRAEYGSDKVEFYPNSSHNTYHNGIYNSKSPTRIMEVKPYTFLFTDRGLYKPGEKLTFRGIDRDLDLGEYEPWTGGYSIQVRKSGWNTSPFYTDSGTCTKSGGFHGTFNLPDDIEPGYYVIDYSRGESHTKTVSFQVAYFRRLNFQVKASLPDLTYYSGDTINMTVAADYLSGGSLSGGSYDYYWSKSSLSFRPPGVRWKPYRFGTDDSDYSGSSDSGNGKLDASGRAMVKKVTGVSHKEGLTYTYTLNANVQDIDNQVIAVRKPVTVHPASFYIGAKFASANEGWWSPFVKKGESVDLQYMLVTPEGEGYRGFDKRSRLNYRLLRVEWKQAQQEGVYNRINTRYERIETVESKGDVSVREASGEFSIKTEESGQYILEISGSDNFNRVAKTRFSFYSTGSGWYNWGREGVNDITLMPDRNKYDIGDTARILVQSPLPEGRYLLTIEREGIFEEKIIELEGSINSIEIPIKPEYLPVCYVSIASYSKRSDDPPDTYTSPDLGKPKGYFGITTVVVDTTPKEVILQIVPTRKSYLPGTEAEVTVKAFLNGEPAVDTEITFLAADRGVLDLINYHVPNPLEYFYDAGKFPLGVIGGDSRSLLIDPVTYETKDLHGGDGEDGKMKKRKDFRPLAVFEPYLKTDMNGEVVVRFKLPDSLTTYRCTAIAVKENNFGIHETEIMVKNPVNVRTALPRKLRLRDTSFAGVIVTNLDGEEHEVTVSIESDILSIDGETTKSVVLPPSSRAEVPFKIVALQPGTATITFTTKSAVLNEQLEVELEIDRPLVKEAFATIGSTKQDDANPNLTFAQEGLVIPSMIASGYGGISVKMNTTRLTNLSASMEYLYDYPFGCLEQQTSKMAPLVLFGDQSKPFLGVKNPEQVVSKQLKYWAKYQNSDGGFAYWLDGSRPSSKYISIRMAKFLHYVKQNGISIPKEMDVEKLLSYISREDKYQSFYTRVYALYARALHGRNVLVRANELYEQNKEYLTLSEYAFFGLLYELNGDREKALKMKQRIGNLIKVGTRTVDVIEPNKRYYFSSQVNDLSLILMLYHELGGNDEMVMRLVNTLMQRQENGYWNNTVATEWVIQAFYHLYQDESGEKTNLTAKVSIDSNEFIKTMFKGAINETYTKDLYFEDELRDFKRDELLPLHITGEGSGTIYYNATIRYALPSEVVMPRDEGLSVFTEISDLNGKKIKDGKGLKLGETYRMKVVVSSNKRRKYVAVRAPIPSGAEVLDSSFVTTAAIEDKVEKNSGYGGYYSWWYKPVQFVYDNEVQYFFNEFFEGKQEMEFMFRVTSPGIYPTPPTTAECMYEEEVFGRTGGMLYVIQP